VANQEKMDVLYMDIAYRIAQMSHAERKKVGAIIVKDGNIIAFGWNGTPHGFDNTCENVLQDGSLVTKDELIHAEQNALAKAAKGVIPVDGATLYVTLSPCWYCSGSIIQSGIKRVVYHEEYRKPESIHFLNKANIKIEQMKDYTIPIF
jgi:dCMP deaminase